MTTQLAGGREQRRSRSPRSGRQGRPDCCTSTTCDLLISMVIVIYVAVTYGVGGVSGLRQKWEEGEMNAVVIAIITLMVVVGTTFCMGPFFMIASYFTPRSYDRKGARMFLFDRLKRLGIPLLTHAVIVRRPDCLLARDLLRLPRVPPAAPRIRRDHPLFSRPRCGLSRPC